MEANPANNNASLTLDSNSKPNARRRVVEVVEKKSRLYVLTEEGVNGVNEDKMIVNGKDLSHTNRGESLVERSKDLSRLKKVSFASSTISPRHKRAIPKRRKAKWQTVLSILTKNCLLLAALLWLGQIVWRLAGRIGDNTNSPFLALDYEGWVYEIEASLKKIANMLQVQVEAVDRKIGNELGIMARELRKQIEEKVAMLEELKKLEVKIDGLDKSLIEFKDMGLLSKEEFEIFRDELARKLDGSDSDVHLDQIMSFARDLVKKEIERHAADGLERVDYALASGGARVVSHSEPHGF